MKVAVTQPYLFPYLGYFALLDRVDVCVLMDDTQFIRRGWIHRNQIPSVTGEPLRFQVPVQKCARETKIRDVRIAPTPWREPLRRTFDFNYAQAPYLAVGATHLAPLWHKGDALLPLLCTTLEQTARHLGLATRFLLESDLKVSVVGAAERVFRLAKAAGGTELHNLPGGRALYDEAWFASQGLPIHFVESDVSWSAIHYLMTEPAAATLARIRDWGSELHTPCTPVSRSPRENENAGSARPE